MTTALDREAFPLAPPGGRTPYSTEAPSGPQTRPWALRFARIPDSTQAARVPAHVYDHGRQVFAAGIHAGSEAAHEDWRSDYGSLTYTTATVPEQVAAGMRRLMERLSLRYGAADFVVDPEGRWTFLEVNPCGQWNWIQGATGLPIAEAIANELQGVT